MLKLPLTSTYLIFVLWLASALPVTGQSRFNYFKEVKEIAFITKSMPIGWADSCQKFIDNMTEDAQNIFFYSFYDQRIIPVSVNENTPRNFINRFFTSERIKEFERLTPEGWPDWKETLKTMYRK